ncbi:dynamin family protein [Solirubrobacter ginsenosidimutans]|uniref:Dynamin family protein n=1 Tax=Solirubrobacter ginsenosidimutans TaxID=490573 RepID=A0A9X3MP48_9ACTN|nr:dynamin family protein [Solirubrobacter ginsenosidimutans]MDA0159804.1 dynamin family protein [Solirubrobacter ginsenosidimutans]
MGPDAAQGLIGELRAVCDAIAADPELQPVHPLVERDRARLGEPLRVAVSGPISAGKSTLVNCLIGRCLAATGSGETTMANWWFRHGPNEVHVRRPDGTMRTMPLEADGTLPPLGPIDLESENPIDVRIDAEWLKGMTVIDTPGLCSPTKERSERARALLRDRTTRAAGMADALVYVTNQIPGAAADDAQLREFQELFGPVSKAPTNAVLILSKVDGWWKASTRDQREPLAIGHSMLAGHQSELRHRVWDALPVVGLLAQTACAMRAIDQTVVADLQALAQSPDRATMLLDRRLLAAARSPLPAERQVALHDAFGMYGLHVALELAERGDPQLLADELRRLSGFERVRKLIDETFRSRSTLLRADALLTSLERLALARHGGLSSQAADRLRGHVETVRTGEHCIALRALQLLREIADRRTVLSASQRDELRELFGADAAAASLPLSLEQVLRRRDAWHALEMRRPSPPQLRRIAAEARRALDDMVGRVDGTTSGNVA